MLAARVLPDVAGFERALDYLVPPDQAAAMRPGCIVRVPLQGRKIRGWVLAYPVEPDPALELRPVEKVIGYGPEPDVVDLAGWAAWFWAGRRRHLLSTGNPVRAVRSLPPPRAATAACHDRWWAELISPATAPGAHLVVVAPSQPVTELVLAVAERGPTLLLAPTSARAGAGALALSRSGAQVALLPDHWEQARSGTGIVVGSRGAAWGPCPRLSAAVVLDAHDEAYAQEQAPTWWAPAVAAERARRAGAPCFWVTPCPTVEMLAAAHPRLLDAGARSAWPVLHIVDMRLEDPRTGLLSGSLATALRSTTGRAVCVLNRKGRAQMLACGACGELARCESCRSALGSEGSGAAAEQLVCRRCGRARPVVCASCGSDGLRVLRAGVARVREQLEALVGSSVAEVVRGSGPVPDSRVVVGTEAVLRRTGELRRGGQVTLVAFLDFDQELLAARYRAGEEALALLALAGRVVGPRRPGVSVLVQTRAPDHSVLSAAATGRPEAALEGEAELRKDLHLPPFSALALVSGDAAPEMVERLRETGAGDVELSLAADGRWVVRAADQAVLADALARAGRPEGRVRIEVGPVRL